MNRINIFLGIIISCVVFIGCSSKEVQEPIYIIATPLVEFSYSPETVRAGEEVSFNARFLTGSSVITSWTWNFGDIGQSTAASQNSSFTFQEEGTYTVALTVSDKNNALTTITEDITVLERLADPFDAVVAWAFTNGTTIPNYNDGASSPAIADDGTIYYLESYGGAESRMIAVEDQSTLAIKKWDYASGSNLRNAPSIGTDGDIYIGAWHNDAMRKIRATNGSEIWAQTTNSGISNSTAAIDANGNIYVGTRAEGIISWDSNGTERWKFKEVTGTGYYASPAISADGTTIYALKSNGFLYAINAGDGTGKWAEPLALTGDGTGSALSINSDGTLYFTTDTHVVAVTDNGNDMTVKWSIEAQGANSSGVVIGVDGSLYVGTIAGLLSLNPQSGATNWLYGAEINESVPAVDSKDNIYFGTADGKLLVVDKSGELLKQFILTSEEVHSPVISDDGSVYVEGFSGSSITLFKIDVANSGGPADSPWPMKGQNRRNTSLAR